jgi:hypothetical protein
LGSAIENEAASSIRNETSVCGSRSASYAI